MYNTPTGFSLDESPPREHASGSPIYTCIYISPNKGSINVNVERRTQNQRLPKLAILGCYEKAELMSLMVHRDSFSSENDWLYHLPGGT